MKPSEAKALNDLGAMNTTKDIFAVVWVDRMVGPLHLKKPSAEEAIAAARHMLAHGAGKIEHVRAIRLDASDTITDLLD